MKWLNASTLEHLLPFGSLIPALEEAFRSAYHTPLRHHHQYAIPGQTEEGTLLLMPSWDDGQYFGVKLVSVSPHNRGEGRPTIQGTYLLFETSTGAPILQCDAKMLTHLRTAAASALAARFLSRPESRTLLMVGTGALAPYLIRAHAQVRPIDSVLIWGRNQENAAALAARLSTAARKQPITPAIPQSIIPVTHLPEAIARADIISCATLSTSPLISGQWLLPGQHLDLVGSFKPNMREADDDAIRRAAAYVDTMEGATQETGDIVIPLKNGTLKKEDIRGDLFSLCRGTAPTRQSAEAITLFKSVGHALEDLAAAKLAWEGQ